ncbi:hypothetical protein BaRGS_00036866, partial [Batillaria attramentaria]
MSSPNLSGPNPDGSVECAVNTSDTSPTAQYKVSWFVNGQPYPRQRELRLAHGVMKAVYNVHDLPTAGMLTCKMRSYYTDRNIMSPFMTSNAADLAVIVSQAGTECDPAVYKELNETHRSAAYHLVHPEHPLCDDLLQPWWYRFTSGAGGKMPEHCIDREKCGTIVPLWMNGTHPTVVDGRVYRYVCANLQSGAAGATPCCEQKVKIAVRNCGNYFVYFIQPTPSCPMAYCAGHLEPCPYGKWSPTGFAPCKDAHPDMTNPPTFSGPEIHEKTFHFTCDIDFKDNDPEQRFEVVWTFGGAVDPSIHPVTVSDPDRRAVLDGALLHGHLGKDIGCKVRAFYRNNKMHAGPYLESNTYWAGIHVSPGTIEVSEGKSEQNVTLTSTIPILCNHDFDCCIQIKLDVNGRSNEARVIHKCRYLMCSTDWNGARKEAVIKVPIIAARDQVLDRDKQLLLEFEELRDNAGGNYATVFAQYRLPAVTVHVKDADIGHCSITNDPYLKNLAGRSFTFQRLGDFTLFRNPARDFEVQVRTGPCVHSTNLPGTCVCGVAVREKDDVVYAYSCGAVDWDGYWHVRELRLVQPREISEGTVVKRSSDGQQILVYLPSSAEVKIQAFTSVINLDLTIPSIDKGHGRGLCGTFDDDRNNDFTRRDGTVDSQGSATANTYNTPFLLSWANDHETSLFRKLPQLMKDKQEKAYCQCDSTHINCTTRGDVTGKVLQCSGVCHNAGKTPTPDPLVPPDLQDVHFENGKRRRALEQGSLYEDLDDTSDTARYDPDLYQDLLPKEPPKWPTPSGVTEQQAEATCRQTVTKSELWRRLQSTNAQHAEQLISNCKSDILYSDSHDFLESLVDAVTTSTQVELAKDPGNFVTNHEGENVLTPEVSSDLCNIQCKRNGHCVRGRCVCNSSNFTGDNCQLIAGIGPQLHNVSGAGLCDINRRPCRRLFMVASNFEMGDRFDCKIQEILPDGTLSSTVIIEPAEFVTPTKLTCPLPDAKVKSDRSVKRYGLQVTTDGSLYGNMLNVTVFDSICQNCTADGCVKLPDTCLINDLCYADRDKNPKDVSKMCIAAENMTQWIQIYPVATPVISGPDSHGDLVCTVNTSDSNPTARYKVSWYVDGVTTSQEVDVPVTSSHVEYRRTQLPATGSVTCKVQSFYNDRNILSPYVVSDAIDLANSPLYPVITVDLAGPDSGNSMRCSVHTPDTNPTARYKVTWYVGDRAVSRELSLPEGVHDAVFNRADLPQTGTVTCKIRSYYSDINVYSPPVVSNGIDLA